MRLLLAAAAFSLIATPALADARQETQAMMQSLVALGDVMAEITETTPKELIADRLNKEVVARADALTNAWFDKARMDKEAYLPFQVCWEAGWEFQMFYTAFVRYARGLEKDPAALNTPPALTEKLTACQKLL